jgi:site-specific recombinase XerD
MFGYLSREEMLAVIGTPGGTWFSQRDHVLLLLLYNTGARVSEISGVKVGEVVLDEGAACVHLHGKGRKQRSVPLWRSTVRAIRAWFRRNPEFGSDSPLLPNRDGQSMSRWNVIQRLDRAVRLAAESCPYLATRQISPHVIRRTTAMHLLQSGVDISVIALWLGHESPATSYQYVEADLAMKERALARLQEPEAKLRRYRTRLADRLPANPLIMWRSSSAPSAPGGRLAHEAGHGST